MLELTPSEWDSFLVGFPNVHLMQTSAWGELKSAFGWEVRRVAVGEAGAQVLFRRLPFGFTLAYIPKGPVGIFQGKSGEDDWDEINENPEAIPNGMTKRTKDWEYLWEELDVLCRRKRAVLLKVEPDLWEEGSFKEEGRRARKDEKARKKELVPPHGFQLSPHAVQPQRTLVVDLSGDEEDILARMKQKTRYNIRLALKKGVVVRSSADLELFYRLVWETGGRDQFGVHSREYYRRAYELFHPHGKCELLLAEYEHQPLAALMVFSHGDRAWYFYGASSNEHRDRMPTYSLQWEAMRWARAQGSWEYDLWGVPDADREILEAQFTERSDGLWGVYRFKRGFGGRLRRSIGPWDRVYQPLLYRFYLWWVGRGRMDK